MSDVTGPLVQVEKALSENHLDDDDRKALDKLVVAHLQKSRAELDGLRQQLGIREAELDRAKQTIEALRAENTGLVKERDGLTKERDGYLDFLRSIVNPQFTF